MEDVISELVEKYKNNKPSKNNESPNIIITINIFITLLMLIWLYNIDAEQQRRSVPVSKMEQLLLPKIQS